MAGNGMSRANENRRIRQEALREWLSEKCTAQHLVDNIDKIEKLDVTSDTFKNELDKYKVANDQRLKVLGKYLPDLKQTDMDIQGDITAKDATRSELEAKLRASGINPEDYD